MKIFTNKKLFKKLLCVIMAMMLFSAVVPTNVSHAASFIETTGGVLLKPVATLMITVGDIVMDVIHTSILNEEECVFIINKSSKWELFLSGLAKIVKVVLAVAGLYFLSTLIPIVGPMIAGGLVWGKVIWFGFKLGVAVAVFTGLSEYANYIALPYYKITPQEIFRNEVEFLDGNIFNVDMEGYETTPTEPEKIYALQGIPISDIGEINNLQEWTTLSHCKYQYEDRESDNYETVQVGGINNEFWEKYAEKYRTGKYVVGDFYGIFDSVTGAPEQKYIEGLTFDKAINEMVNKDDHVNYAGLDEAIHTVINTEGYQSIFRQIIDLINAEFGKEVIPAVKRGTDWGNTALTKPDDWRLYFSKCYIFQDTEDEGNYYTINKILFNYGASERMFEVYCIKYYNQNEDAEHFEVRLKLIAEITESEVIEQREIVLAKELRQIITKWYYTIRTFVLVVMMIILLYIGIRIMISGIASEKAKYKSMLLDWIVAICLILAMHYIMAFASNLVDAITEIFNTIAGDTYYTSIIELDDKMEDKLEDALAGTEFAATLEEGLFKENGRQFFAWETKNLLGIVRTEAARNSGDNWDYIGMGIVYVVLVAYTVFFLFTYIKRLLYIIFLTIIAPFVAMTYPIDKIHDGKAQAFNMWFKEYIFNLMIQPFHLLLYTILIGSAVELASSNKIYTLVAVGFMMPAEKFLRKMFGFDKAQTPGFLGGAAGAAIAMTGLTKLFNRRPSKGGIGAGHDDGGKAEKEDKVNFWDKSAVDPTLLADSSSPVERSSVVPQDASGPISQNPSSPTNQNPSSPTSQNTNGSIVPNGNNPRVQTQGRNNIFDPQQQDLDEKASKRANRREKTKSRIKGEARGMWRATTTYAGKKFKRLGKYVKSGKPIRALTRAAKGFYVGATGALLGASLGIASGDAGKVGQNAALLGAAGYALGARDKKPDPDVAMAAEEYERSRYASEDEYRKHVLAEQRKEVYENDKKQKALRTYLKLQSDKEAKAKMQQYGEFIDAGITDMEDFATAVKLVEKNGWEKDKAITAAQYYKKAGGKPKNMGERDRANIEYQYRNIIDPDRTMDNDQANEIVRIMLKNLDEYGSTKDDLTKA